MGLLDGRERGLDLTRVGDVAAHVERAPVGAPPLRVVTATRSPPARNASAIARPIPRLPPVTRTDLGSGLGFCTSLTSRDASDYPRVDRTGGPSGLGAGPTHLVVLEPEPHLHADLEVL